MTHPHALNEIYSIGLMSGTSMDGIDASLLKLNATTGEIIGEVAHEHLPYSSCERLLLKGCESIVRSVDGNIEMLKKDEEQFIHLLKKYLTNFIDLSLFSLNINVLHYQNVELFSTALHAACANNLIKKAGLTHKDIAIVGYHGQTVCHQPHYKRTIALGDGQRLADLLSIPVVSRFRDNDLAMGGKGAPLAPLYHFARAKKDNLLPVGIINCGGIANVTLIPDENPMHMFAYDSGPGNVLIDQFVRLKTKGAFHMDEDAQFAKLGTINPTALMAQETFGVKIYNSSQAVSPHENAHNYFSLKGPKALDSADLVLTKEVLDLSLEDGCATLAYHTAKTIVDSLNLYTTNLPSRWILAGGGWKNLKIYQHTKALLEEKLHSNPVVIQTADQVGWTFDAVEANIFAYLAWQSKLQQPLSLPNTTGVTKPITGGKLYLPREGK